MNLEITKPIVFFDLETTGVNVTEDRIIELFMLKLMPDYSSEQLHLMLDPTIPIPEGATEVHGIREEDVKGKPTFHKVHGSIYKFVHGCDLGGYNVMGFDIPLLAEEFARCKLDTFPAVDVKIVDVFAIERTRNPRTLENVYRNYTGKEPKDAHHADADVNMTVEILLAMLDKYEIPASNAEALSEESGQHENFDLTGKIKIRDGEPVFGFGKHVNKKIITEKGYLHWMLNSDFPAVTKNKIREFLNENK